MAWREGTLAAAVDALHQVEIRRANEPAIEDEAAGH